MIYVILAEVSEILTSAAVSLVVSFIAGIFSFLTAKKEKLNFYSSTVSKERIEWINKTREITSDLVAFCAVHTEEELATNDLFQFEKLRNMLLLRLSPKELKDDIRYEGTDGKVISLLDDTKSYTEIRDNRYEIRDIITIICKNEWNRIKAEAGGDKGIEKKVSKGDNKATKAAQKRINQAKKFE